MIIYVEDGQASREYMRGGSDAVGSNNVARERGADSLSLGKTNKIPRRYLRVQAARVRWNFSNKIEAFGGTELLAKRAV